ncbi:hypothetical protein J7E99_06945 [Streptomyces sp. ISL-44]|uniref:hypothetical protein n=1 Tax=unclassified Streptomyces TaxID=2593676 RepID=UPI001BEC348C|nr:MULTISPECIES: hypothetical protein [unclassified Streptomyces]MBT2540447.1 hypothetical protein [Streptomyces sp. ISL-44]MCX5608174.1 hypothetical protein [Streptomyces sp. NBC_00047]UUU42220.1 hypothetical protein JIW86_27450 [Streptomyces sp. NBC_00162]
MIEMVVVVLAAAGAGWLLRRKHLARTATGPVPGIPGMARRPAGEGRWRAGRVYADEGAARWVPQRGEPVPLPGGRATGVRVPSVKEGISINPGSRIVTCTYEGGGSIEIAVMPLDLRELLEAVGQTDTDTPSP